MTCGCSCSCTCLQSSLHQPFIACSLSHWCSLFVTLPYVFWSDRLHLWMDNYHNKQAVNYLFYSILFLYTGECSWFIPDKLWCSELDDGGDGSGTKPRCLETSQLLNLKWIGNTYIWTREKYPKSDRTVKTYSAICSIILQCKNMIGKNIFLHTNQSYNWGKKSENICFSPPPQSVLITFNSFD